MNLLLKPIWWMVEIAMLTLLGIQSLTPAMASVKDEYFARLTPVSEAVLDSMRGGFQRDPDGPFMSFGIERSVFINEKLINSTAFNIPDMKQLANHDFNLFADHSNTKPVAGHPSDTFSLIQSGPGNSFPHDVSSLPPFMTVIQNSLDNRTIESHTVINATVEALTWAKSLDMGNALSQANIDAIRH